MVSPVLRETFGIEGLREPQHKVVARVLAGRSTLALMPTGAGKSLCYQLPSSASGGSHGVVSPPIALMKDQCDALRGRCIAAVRLPSGLAAVEEAHARSAIDEGSARIVFTTAEQLQEEGLPAALQARPVELLVIDEAHCIAKWGLDLRPAFSSIAEAIGRLGRSTVLGLAATPPVAAAIRQARAAARSRPVDG